MGLDQNSDAIFETSDQKQTYVDVLFDASLFEIQQLMTRLNPCPSFLRTEIFAVKIEI